jgi:hypothetical protein
VNDLAGGGWSTIAEGWEVARPRVFLARLIPEPGPSLLAAQAELVGNLEDRGLTRDELLRGVRGADGIFGSATVETRGRMAEMAATNALAVLAGDSASHLANPEVLTRRGRGPSGLPAGRGAVP